MSKKIIILVLALVFALSGCSNGAEGNTATTADNATLAAGNAADNANIVEIKEKMFIQQCNDVYLNPGNYKGKQIKIEGMYSYSKDETSGKEFISVIRYGPGCCGNDGLVGFNFSGDTSSLKQNDWIEVIGTVKATARFDGGNDILLQATSIKKLEKRGLETVES